MAIKRWGSWIMSAIPALILLASATMKLAGVKGLGEGFAHLGWPLNLAFELGVLELTCTVLYLIPATSVLGLHARCLAQPLPSPAKTSAQSRARILSNSMAWLPPSPQRHQPS